MYKTESQSVNKDLFMIENDDIVKRKRFNKKKLKSSTYCGNCGKFGHPYKNCLEPITSMGVILFSINSNKDRKPIADNLSKRLKATDSESKDRESLVVKADGIKYENASDIQIFCEFRNRIKFLLIRRKHTLGYIEFIRGRYQIEHVDGIIFLFKQMTSGEIVKIGSSTFDDLWNELWLNNKHKASYQTEYIQSKQKFEKLKSENDNYLNLDYYVDNVVPTWDFAEWGFPKGRRNFQENNYDCAIREFEEESGFVRSEYLVLDKIKPMEEKLIGTNGIGYKHIYYPAISLTDREPVLDNKNKFQIDEIGDIGWFTYDEAMKLIRPYHTERKRLLTELYMYIINNISKIY